MKHKGSRIDFTPQRNEHLLRCYLLAIAQSKYIDIGHISEEIVEMECPRFWVSEERAATVVSAMARGKAVTDNMFPLRREMFEEIYRRVQERKRRGDRRPLCDIVMDVVNSPAPKFYLQPRCAMEIIYRLKREARKEGKGLTYWLD